MLILAMGIGGIVVLVVTEERLGESLIVSSLVDDFLTIEGDTLTA